MYAYTHYMRHMMQNCLYKLYVTVQIVMNISLHYKNNPNIYFIDVGPLSLASGK